MDCGPMLPVLMKALFPLDNGGAREILGGVVLLPGIPVLEVTARALYAEEKEEEENKDRKQEKENKHRDFTMEGEIPIARQLKFMIGVIVRQGRRSTSSHG
ncbi:hypothetical protein SLA2020_456210 [Shorea laevis]